MVEEIVVLLLEGPDRGEDDVGEAGRLVQVEVYRHHELEVLERLLRLEPVRHREHRVARDGDETPDLPFAGRHDLFGQDAHRKLVREFGAAAHA